MKKWLLFAGVLAAGAALKVVLDERARRPLEYDAAPIAIASVLLHTGDHLALPADLEVVDGRLVVIDRRGAKNIHVLDAGSGEHIASVGDPGEGPAEFLAPASITRDPEGRVWIHDGEAQRMTRLDLVRLDESRGWADSSFRLRGSAFALDLAWTAEGRLLAVGLFTGGRFGIYDDEGRLIAERGEFPELPGNPPAVVRQQILLSRFVSRPDGRLFAAATSMAARIDIVSPTGEARGEARVPLPFEPEFEIRDSGGFPAVIHSRESPSGYLDMAATGDRLLALFSGRAYEDFERRSSYGRDVHVFDWSGRLLGVLRADRDLFAIGIDGEAGRLYGIQHDPVPAILVFDLVGVLDRD